MGGVGRVRERGKIKGQRDDRLAGRVKELDPPPLQVLSLREGVDPGWGCGLRRGLGLSEECGQGQHVRLAVGQVGVTRET